MFRYILRIVGVFSLLNFVIMSACTTHQTDNPDQQVPCDREFVDVESSAQDAEGSVRQESLKKDLNQQLDDVYEKMYSCSLLNSKQTKRNSVLTEDCLFFLEHIDYVIESEYEPASLAVYSFLYKNERACSIMSEAVDLLTEKKSERDSLLCKVLEVIWLDCCVEGYDDKPFKTLANDIPLFQENKLVEGKFNQYVVDNA